jgi:hypothetical protein
VTHCGFTYDLVMSGFRDVEAQDYTLIAEDTRSLTYLFATNAEVLFWQTLVYCLLCS